MLFYNERSVQLGCFFVSYSIQNYNGGYAMEIQNMVNQCCAGVGKFAAETAKVAATSAQWIGKTVVVLGQHALAAASKVAQFVGPLFSKLGQLAMQNRAYLLSGAVGTVVGVAGFSLLNQVFKGSCCSGASTQARSA